MYFALWNSNTYFYEYNIVNKGVFMWFIERETQNFILQFWENLNFPMKRNSVQGPRNEIW